MLELYLGKRVGIGYNIFSIFDSFYFVNCLMIVVLQKLFETQGLQSKFHELYIYIYYMIALS